MEERKLNEKESLELIAQMIQNTKNRLETNCIVCDLSPRAERVPAFTRESERGPFAREVENRDEKRFGTALWR